MLHFTPFYRRVIFSLCTMLLFYVSSYAQLSGNYTIDPNSSASNSNYQDWASAVGDLLSGSRSDGGNAQGPGVGGAVTITVYDTIYSTQVELTAISGASSTNTITFTSAGGDSTKCVLRYASGTSSSGDYVLMLNGADYVTFSKIGFERTGTNDYATVIQITNSADYNKFYRCWMKGKKVPSNSSQGFAYGVGSIIYFTGNGDFIELVENKMIYGYNGIYNANSCTDVSILGNSIDTSGSSGIYSTGQTNFKVIGNSCNMGDFGPNTGHYTSYAMRIESSPSMIISKNKMLMFAKNAQVVRALIIANTTSTASNPTLITNNWIMNDGGTGSCSGFAQYACSYIDFCYNNLMVNSPLTTASAYYQYPQYTSNNIKLMNNNIINKGKGLVYDVPGTNTGNLDTVDYNNVYGTGANFGTWSGSTYTSFSAWATASSKDANSVNVDPGFPALNDLHVSHFGLNGKALPYFRVTDDIDGDARNATTPDIGADEFTPASNDAGVSSVDSPSVFCAGVQNVKVTFQNYGLDTLKSVDIGWSVNGVTQTTYNWTGSIASGNSSSSVKLGSYSFSANTPYIFKIWTEKPNSSTDVKTTNDTITLTRYAGLTGTYIVGDTGTTDFKSFSDALSAMSARGICGPITFNVNPGIYNEQITMVNLPGMSASNPIIFQNRTSDSTKVVVTLPSTSATGINNAAIQFRGASYVTIKGITFQRTGTNPYAQVVHVLNSSHHNTMTNCQMLGLVLTAANTNAINIWSDQSADSYNTFKYNYVKGGHNNISYSGVNGGHESGTVIEGNIFDSAYNSSVQVLYNDNITIRKNIFRNVVTSASGNYDLQLLDCDSGNVITENYFNCVNTENAIYHTLGSGTAGKPALIANNMIIKSSGNGILMDQASYQDIAFNSIYFAGSTSTNAGIATSSNTSGNIVMKNNNIVMEGGYAFSISSGSHISASDYNNIYSKGGQVASWGGNTYNSRIALRNATQKDSNSVSVDPYFTSVNDLHVKNSALKEAGIPFAGVTTDYDGQTRNTTTPDIGADEFELVPDDAGIIDVTEPLNGACEGIRSVSVVIKNFGKDNLKSATINWEVDGHVQNPYNWSGSLSTKATDTVTLGTYNFVGGTTLYIIAKAVSPNGNTDGVSANDSFIMSMLVNSLPSVSAGPDTAVCMGDSIELGTFGNFGFTYEWRELPSNSVISTLGNVFVKPSTATGYKLRITETATGCSNFDSLVVSVNSLPMAIAGTDQTVCPGTNVGIGTSAQAGFSYDWTSIPSGFTSQVANPNVVPTQATDYIMRIINDVTGCYDDDTVSIGVNAAPVAFATGDSIACDGSTKVYTTNLVTGNSYSWSITGGTITNGQNTNTVTVVWNTPGAGNIQVTETNNLTCNGISDRSVNVLANPVPMISTDGVCRDKDILFYDSTATSQSRTWRFGDGQTSTLIDPTHTYSTAGNYNITLIVEDADGCTDSATQTLTIVDPPQVSFTLDANACVGKNVAFNSGTTTGNNTYDWAFGDGQGSSLQSTTHAYNSTGSYTARLLISNSSGCSDSLTKNINVVDAPNPNFSISTKNCQGDSIFFTNSSTDASSYTWHFGNGQTSTNQDPFFIYNTTGVYSVKLIAQNLGCNDSLTKQVTVNPTPTSSFTATTNNLQVSFTDQSSVSSGSIVSWDWDFGDATPHSTSQSPSHTYAAAGTFNVTLCVTTSSGCRSCDSDNVQVSAAPGSIGRVSGLNFSVYPNPGNGNYAIRCASQMEQIIVTDMLGQVIATFRPGATETSIDLTTHAHGVYFVEVIAGDLRGTMRVVKQ